MNARRILSASALLCLLFHAPAHAQWLEQEISLQPGWNAISIDVDPAERDPKTLLSSITWESLWTLLPAAEGRREQWLVHYANEPAFLNTLLAVQGGRPYLLKTPSAGTLRVRGQPARRRRTLCGDCYNLFGAVVDRSAPPTFAEFFSRPETRGKIAAIFEISGETLQPVSEDTQVRPGEAYWVLPSQDLADPAPLRLTSEGQSIEFADQAGQRELVIEVPESPESRDIEIRAVPSVPAPEGEPRVAEGGADWLQFQTSSGEWRRLASGTSLVVPAETNVVRLPVRALRQGQDPATRESGRLFQAVVEVKSEEGNLARVGAAMEVPFADGIWIGEATLHEVAVQSAFGAPRFEPAPPMRLSLILSIPQDSREPIRLLDQVRATVDRDGRPLVYRLNAVTFHEPVNLSGTIGGGGTNGTLSGASVLSPTQPLNPYRHRYNPEHREGYAIERQIQLAFAAEDQDPERAAIGFERVDGLFGTYEEEIRGVSVEPIRVRGSFALRRFADSDRVDAEN